MFYYWVKLLIRTIEHQNTLPPAMLFFCDALIFLGNLESAQNKNPRFDKETGISKP